MKQLLQGSGSGETEVADVPAPGRRPGHVLVRTSASLISAGTERAVVDFTRKNLLDKARARPDLVKKVVNKIRTDGLLTTVEATRSRLAQPMALGYSAAGIVIDVGEGVAGFTVGDRVACAGAGYAVHAEVLSVPKNMAARVPDGVPLEAAAFATVAAIGLHGLRLGEPQLGETVVVIGLGLIGLLTVQMAEAAGCRVLGIDLDPGRARLARDLGAHRTAVIGSSDDPVAAALEMTGGRGADLVLVCASSESSSPTILAGDLARDRGRVVAVGAVGMEIPRRTYYHKELDFRVSRSYGPGRYDPVYEEQGVDYPPGYVRWTQGRNLEAVLDLAAAGKLVTDPLVTHRIPIQEGERAYELISDPDGEPVLAVVLTYAGDADAQAAVSRTVPTGAAPVPAGSVGVGVLGAGLFATNTLLPAMKETAGLHLTGVASAGGVSSRHAADRFGGRFATTDVRTILEDPECDVVAILTRHDLHARQVCEALEAGKHVFCEKPLCLSTDELDAISAAREAAARLIMVGFNRRFAPFAIQMKEVFDGIGEPLSLHYRVNAGALPLEHWVHDPRVGGGRIIGEGCHFIDFMSFLTDALPVRVFAGGVTDGGRYRRDNVSVTVFFSDGSVGTVQYVASGPAELGKERCEAFGGGRAAVLDDFRTLERIEGGRKTVHRARLRQEKGHREELAALAAGLRAGTAPISFESIRATTLATFAAEASLSSGDPVDVESVIRPGPGHDEPTDSGAS